MSSGARSLSDVRDTRDGNLLKFEAFRVEMPDQQFTAEVTGQTSQEALHNLAVHYGEDRYRLSPLIARRHAVGQRLSAATTLENADD